MHEQMKRCPYRKDASGGFELCYGQDCMAYCEYDVESVIYNPEQIGAKEIEKTHMTMCRMMAPVLPPVSCV